MGAEGHCWLLGGLGDLEREWEHSKLLEGLVRVCGGDRDREGLSQNTRLGGSSSDL